MEKLFLIILLIPSISSCSYRSDSVTDKGEWVSMPADSSVDGYNNTDGQIYWGYIVGMDFTEEDNVGVYIETFRVCKDSEYAKDKHHVYYPQVVICYDGIKEDNETGEYEGVGGEVAEKLIISGAKPSQFKYIGNGYAVSGNKMFHNGEVIEWNDSIAKLNL